MIACLYEAHLGDKGSCGGHNGFSEGGFVMVAEIQTELPKFERFIRSHFETVNPKNTHYHQSYTILNLTSSRYTFFLGQNY